jgi:heat shock protein HslJ
METSTSKTAANILIVTAILLIATSLVIVLNKKPSQETTKVEVATQPTTEVLPTATTTTSTTTEATTIIATSTATSTLVTIEGFTDKSWTWIKTSATGTKAITPKKTTAFTLMFTSDGTVKGTTDCNAFSGSYKIDNSKLSFGPLASTKMFCNGSQEEVFMKSLLATLSYAFATTTSNLTLTTASGTIFFK